MMATNEIIPSGFWNDKQAAEFLGMSRRTLSRLTSEGEIPEHILERSGALQNALQTMHAKPRNSTPEGSAGEQPDTAKGRRKAAPGRDLRLLASHVNIRQRCGKLTN